MNTIKTYKDSLVLYLNKIESIKNTSKTHNTVLDPIKEIFLTFQEDLIKYDENLSILEFLNWEGESFEKIKMLYRVIDGYY